MDEINPPEESRIVMKYWLYIILGIFTVNSLILDLFVFFPKKQSPPAIPSDAVISNAPKNYCSQGCIDQINLTLKSEKISPSPSAKPVVTVTQSPTPTIRPTLTPSSSPTPTPEKTVKEFFVPLGAGTGKSADWTVVDGLGAKVDPSDYGNIKQVTFEVTAFVPTGNQTIWIRLYNAATYQSVANSELTLSGGTATLLTSSLITLASGNNLYQVQMKTQLQYPANINMARLRIKTN